jgi:membrane fusion protein (multidrug efflux system)
MKTKMKITNMNKRINISKPMRQMLIVMGIILSLILAYQLIVSAIKTSNLEDNANNPISVATLKVEYQDWQKTLNAIGNLFAAHGVLVTTEIDGRIQEIFIKSNQEVKKGDKIIQLYAEPDIAALASLQAQADLARLIYERSIKQFAFHAVSKEDLEINKYTMLTQQALADEQQAIVNLKTITAPFDGEVGISKLSPGQLIQEGDPIISLQSTDLLYAYFYLPEQHLPKLKVGQVVELQTDNFPDKIFPGKITAIDPLVDSDTHNIQLEAAFDNQADMLLPGMYTRVNVIIGEPEKRLTIPQAAISYNPYGNYVYLVIDEKENQDEEDKKNDEENKSQTTQTHKPEHKHKSKHTNQLYVKQQLVTVGASRGDQIEILTGLKEGDEIVTAGQVKLRNHAPIIINNSIQPSNEANPQVTNEN